MRVKCLARFLILDFILLRSTNHEATQYTIIPFLLLRIILFGTLFKTSSMSALCAYINNMQHTATSTLPNTKLIRMLIRTFPLIDVLYFASKTFLCFGKHNLLLCCYVYAYKHRLHKMSVSDSRHSNWVTDVCIDWVFTQSK